MTFSLAFVALVAVIVVSPGLDFALVVRNTVVGGRRGGVVTLLGICAAACLQGVLVAFGLAAVIVRIEPLFVAVKWAGVAYLAWLAFTSWRSALRGQYDAPLQFVTRRAWAAFRQGFICNITNPKILVFYLSLLPQFVAPDAPWFTWLAHAWAVPAVGGIWLLGVIVLVERVAAWLQRRAVRRVLDACMGTLLGGWCVQLGRETAGV